AGYVLRRQPAAMCLDDLAADGQAKPRILAERLACRTIGVETLEDALDVVNPYAGAVIIDRDDYMSRRARQGDDDAPLFLRHEGSCVLDQVGDDLAQPQIVAQNVKRARALALLVDADLDIDGLAVAARIARCIGNLGHE